jgi:hypothetical protein
MSKDKPSLRKPPKAPIKSVQYDLFTTFLTNDEGAVSNAIELWDGIPKYFLTAKQQEKLRTPEGLAQSYQWEYSYQGKSFKVRIQPALIAQKDGRDKAFFPSVTEEMIEEALKKILTDQQYGIHDFARSESWVKFSLGMLYKELKERGRARSRAEIKHAITVLSRCILTLYQDEKEIYSGPILSDLVTVNREKYLADTDSYHAARLPVFVSHGINRLQYRQFNYARLMDCDEQLTRWLYKRFVHRYRHASLMDNYHFLFSEVKQASGLLQQATDRRNRIKLLSALDELKRKNVLLRYTVEEIKDGRKIVDVKYTVTAAPEFIGEQKAANKRDRQNLDKAKAQHLRVVDKFD